MNILSWNCRGLGNASTVTSLRAFLRSTRADLFFLSETKCSDTSTANCINTLGPFNYCTVPAIGLAGGLCVGWSTNISTTVISKSPNLIHLEIAGSRTQPPWALLCIYGPPCKADRPNFWSHMEILANSITLPLLCIGDLNSINSQRDKRGGKRFQPHSFRHFSSWMHSAGLLDLGFS